MKRPWPNGFASFAFLAFLLSGDFAVRAALAPEREPSSPEAPPTLAPVANAPGRAGSRGVDPTCAKGTAPMSHRFASGAQWQMCWRVDPHQGLVLAKITYTAPGAKPLTVIEEMALSQLEVPYDSGKRMTRDITDHGFGGRNMRTLKGDDCVGERVEASIPDFGTGAVGGSETRAILCVDEVDAGLGRRSTWGGRPISRRGRTFELSTLSTVGWYEYMTHYGFGEGGEIVPRLGATGDLSPEDFTDAVQWGSPVGPGSEERAVSHSHNAVWRIHWALGGEQRVQEYNADFADRRGDRSAVIDGTWTTLHDEAMRLRRSRRWWRVVGPDKNGDGHDVSYKIQLDGVDDYTPHAASSSDTAGSRGVGDTDAAFGYDIAFSEYDACELYATRNLLAGCPTNDVPAIVANRQRLRDVVSWVAVSFHHVPRDEDQSPMDVHWQGFSMLPFDAFAQNPLTPGDRADVNGRTSDASTSR